MRNEVPRPARKTCLYLNDKVRTRLKRIELDVLDKSGKVVTMAGIIHHVLSRVDVKAVAAEIAEVSE